MSVKIFFSLKDILFSHNVNQKPLSDIFLNIILCVSISIFLPESKPYSL